MDADSSVLVESDPVHPEAGALLFSETEVRPEQQSHSSSDCTTTTVSCAFEVTASVSCTSEVTATVSCTSEVTASVLPITDTQQGQQVALQSHSEDVLVTTQESACPTESLPPAASSPVVRAMMLEQSDLTVPETSGPSLDTSCTGDIQSADACENHEGHTEHDAHEKEDAVPKSNNTAVVRRRGRPPKKKDEASDNSKLSSAVGDAEAEQDHVAGLQPTSRYRRKSRKRKPVSVSEQSQTEKSVSGQSETPLPKRKGRPPKGSNRKYGDSNRCYDVHSKGLSNVSQKVSQVGFYKASKVVHARVLPSNDSSQGTSVPRSENVSSSLQTACKDKSSDCLSSYDKENLSRQCSVVLFREQPLVQKNTASLLGSSSLDRASPKGSLVRKKGKTARQKSVHWKAESTMLQDCVVLLDRHQLQMREGKKSSFVQKTLKHGSDEYQLKQSTSTSPSLLTSKQRQQVNKRLVRYSKIKSQQSFLLPNRLLTKDCSVVLNRMHDQISKTKRSATPRSHHRPAGWNKNQFSSGLSSQTSERSLLQDCSVVLLRQQGPDLNRKNRPSKIQLLRQIAPVGQNTARSRCRRTRHLQQMSAGNKNIRECSVLLYRQQEPKLNRRGRPVRSEPRPQTSISQGQPKSRLHQSEPSQQTLKASLQECLVVLYRQQKSELSAAGRLVQRRPLQETPVGQSGRRGRPSKSKPSQVSHENLSLTQHQQGPGLKRRGRPAQSHSMTPRKENDLCKDCSVVLAPQLGLTRDRKALPMKKSLKQKTEEHLARKCSVVLHRCEAAAEQGRGNSQKRPLDDSTASSPPPVRKARRAVPNQAAADKAELLLVLKGRQRRPLKRKFVGPSDSPQQELVPKKRGRRTKAKAVHKVISTESSDSRGGVHDTVPKAVGSKKRGRPPKVKVTHHLNTKTDLPCPTLQTSSISSSNHFQTDVNNREWPHSEARPQTDLQNGVVSDSAECTTHLATQVPRSEDEALCLEDEDEDYYIIQEESDDDSKEDETETTAEDPEDDGAGNVADGNMYIVPNAESSKQFQDIKTCSMLVTDCSEKAGEVTVDLTMNPKDQDEDAGIVSDSASEAGGRDTAPESQSCEIHSEECHKEAEPNEAQNKKKAQEPNSSVVLAEDLSDKLTETSSFVVMDEESANKGSKKSITKSL